MEIEEIKELWNALKEMFEKALNENEDLIANFISLITKSGDNHSFSN